MNLAQIQDSLRKRKGKWFYTSYKYESSQDLEDGGVRPVKGGLGKTKDGKIYKLLKIVKSNGSEPATADEIQKLLKENWNSIKGNQELFSDLYDRFYQVLALNLPAWKKVYNNPKTITVSLKIAKSTSDLALEFCETVPDTVISGVSIKFSAQEAFTKGKNPKFNKEDYKKYLMSKVKSPMSEEEAEKASNVGEKEWNAVLERATKEGRDISAHSDLPPKRRYLMNYAKDFIVRTSNFEYDGMVDVVVDDFVTTGLSIRKMVSAVKIEDGTAIGVALFTK